MGIVLAASREYKASLEMFQRAAELAPKQGEFHYHLAQNFLALKRPREAIQHITTAVESNPLYPHSYLLLSRLLVAAKAEDRARAILREGLRHIPDEPRLLADLAKLDAAAAKRP